MKHVGTQMVEPVVIRSLFWHRRIGGVSWSRAHYVYSFRGPGTSKKELALRWGLRVALFGLSFTWAAEQHLGSTPVQYVDFRGME